MTTEATTVTAPPQSADTRQRILDAACTVVVRDGYADLTLDGVAREAAVSKGGLLYHFPSKRALVEGMVEHRCRQFETEVNALVEHEHGPGRWLRAIIRASCRPKEIPLQEGAALFAVLANDPELLEVMRQRRRRFQERIDADGIDAVDAALVCLAVDGLCFGQIMGVERPMPDVREKLVARLLELAGEPARKLEG